jgi:hypothetical protein
MAPRAHITAAPLRPGDPAITPTCHVPVRPFVCRGETSLDVRQDVFRSDERERHRLLVDRRVRNGDVRDDHFAAVERRRLEDVTELRRGEGDRHFRLHAGVERLGR